jgi:hypothetical protein
MRKTISISAVFMIALSVAGVSYGMWYKTLYLSGKVYTDSVDGKWVYCSNLDPPAPPISYDPIDPNDPQYLIYGPREPKDVGWTNVTGLGTDTLIVTLNNTYPSYYNDLETHYVNNGSIPVKIQNITVTPLGGWNLASTWNGTDGPIWVKPWDGIGAQLEPGDIKTQSFEIHVTQVAAQGATYQFQVQYLLVQWQEYKTP